MKATIFLPAVLFSLATPSIVWAQNAKIVPVTQKSSSATQVAPKAKRVPEAAAPKVVQNEPKDSTAVLRLQIFLDAHQHGPGTVDGAMGEFTRQAANCYCEANQLPRNSWNTLKKASEAYCRSPHTTYELKKNDFRFVVSQLPEDPKVMNKYKYLGYRSIAEFIAERFHTTESYLAKANPNVKFSKLQPGDRVLVPNVESPFEIEKVPYSQAYEKNTELSGRKVDLDTKRRLAKIYDSKGKLIASFPITPGKDKFIKEGEFLLRRMITTPEFRWDKAMLERGEVSEEFYQLPPGPNSPVGIFWASTSRKGIGLHGTATPHTIGRSQSAGCVRFANWDAVRLPELIRPGAKLLMR